MGIDPSKKGQHVYAIPVRFMDKVPKDCKLKNLNDEVNKKLDDMMKTSKVGLIELAFMDLYIDEWSDIFKIKNIDIIKNKEKFDDKENMLLKLYEKINDIKAMIDSIKPWINAQRKINGIDHGKYTYDRWSNKNPVLPDIWLEVTNQQNVVKTHMPLINYISSFNNDQLKVVTNSIIDYANLCHKRLEETKSKVSLANTQI